MVDLKDENRAIVKYGIAKINACPCNGINALRQVAGVSERALNAVGVTYSLAPRINAAGRIESAETALKLLICDNLATALDIADKVDGCNRQRHEFENEIMDAAVAHIENNVQLKFSKVIVVCGEGWHHGVVGIVAARLVEKYGKPAIVIAFDGDEGTGSARSIDGFSVYDAIKAVKPDYILHTAGKNDVKESWEKPAEYVTVNVLATVHLLEAVRKVKNNGKILVIGSALEFDPSGLPNHPYGLTKTFQSLVAKSWDTLFHLPIMIAKPTNLIGPGPSNGFCSLIAEK